MEKKDLSDNYFYSIAYEFLSRSKRSYFLTPLEIDLIVKWEKKKIPLFVIVKALKAGFRKPGRKKSLLYFRGFVEREFKKYMDTKIGKEQRVKIDTKEKNEEIFNMIEFIRDEEIKKLYLEFFSSEKSIEERDKFDKIIEDKIKEKFLNEKALKEAEKEWDKRFPFISVDEKTKKKLKEKYIIV